MATNTSITGVFDRVRFRSPDPDSNFIIAYLEDGTCVKGDEKSDGDLMPGVPYQFYGRWKNDPEHGRYFRFQMYSAKEPHSKAGIVGYLRRYACGVGPAIAARLFDAFGSEAVKVLRTQPDIAVAASGKYLTIEKAREAATALQAIAELEDTKIELADLFSGRGFPGVLVEECINRWGILAPARIRRDPYSLLVNEMSGCGFARCDRLYTDLGLPLHRIKRLVVCLWHVLHSDTSGNTWFDADEIKVRFGEQVGVLGEIQEAGDRPRRLRPGFRNAVRCAVRAGWLAKRRDDTGKLWLAESQRAENERYLAEKLAELMQWTVGCHTEHRSMEAVA
ncbi:MAG TPA: helix-hairpin-helix domain-containing protein [Pirellulales bacterium]|nr:helix-hairpin-helix domain-containing protein [Pirellulales bacterium]